MKLSLKLAFWLLVLLCLSAMTGFITILNEAPYTPKSDYLFAAIMGTIITVLVVGGICFIIYKILKKRGNTLAGKRALQCYTVLVLAMTFIGSFQFNSSIQKRDRTAFLEQFDATLTAFIYTKIDTSKYPTANEDSLAENVDDFISCIKMELEFNKSDLLDRLMEAEDKIDFLQKDAEFKEIENRCLEITSK